MRTESAGEDPYVQQFEGFKKVSGGLMECELCRSLVRQLAGSAKGHLDWHAENDGR